MDSLSSLPATPQTPPWYRQRGLQLLLASVLFLLPLAAVPVVTSQPSTRQALSLRSQRVLRLQAFRGDATTVLVAQTATGLLRSIDDGNSFARIDLGLPRSGLGKLRLVDWALSAADPSRVYALVGKPGQERLYRSDNGGETWRVAGRLPASQTKDRVLRTLALASSNFATLYVIGDRSIWRSSDGGRTWANAWPLPQEIVGRGRLLVAVNSQDPDTIFASTGVGLWRSENGGQSWDQAGDLPPRVELGSIASANDRSGLIFVGGRGLVFSSQDGGESWTATTLPNAQGLVRVLLVDARVGETAFASDETSQIFRTDDAGGSWQFVDSASGQQILDLALNPAGHGQLVSASNDGIWGQSVPLLVPTLTPTTTPTPTPTHTPTYRLTHADSYPDRHANLYPDVQSAANAYTDADRHGHKGSRPPRHTDSHVVAYRTGRQRHQHPCRTRSNQDAAGTAPSGAYPTDPAHSPADRHARAGGDRHARAGGDRHARAGGDRHARAGADRHA